MKIEDMSDEDLCERLVCSHYAPPLSEHEPDDYAEVRAELLRRLGQRRELAALLRNARGRLGAVVFEICDWEAAARVVGEVYDELRRRLGDDGGPGDLDAARTDGGELQPRCPFPGSPGPCLPRPGDGRCTWCERELPDALGGPVGHGGPTGGAKDAE